MESVYLPEVKADFLSQLYPYYNKKVYYFNYNYSSFSYTQQPGYFRKVVVRNYIVPITVSQNTIILNFDPKITEEIYVVGTMTIGDNTIKDGKVTDKLGKVAITGDGTAFIWIIYNSGLQLNLPTSAMDEMLFDAYLHTMGINDALPIYMSDPRIIPDGFFEETGINVVKKSLRQGFICTCDKEKVNLAIKLFGNESLAPYVPQIESLPVEPCVDVSFSEVEQVSEDIAILFNDYKALSEYAEELQSEIYVNSENIAKLSEEVYNLSETIQSGFSIITAEQLENLLTQIESLQNVLNYLTSQMNIVGQHLQSELITTSEQKFSTIANLLINELFAIINGYRSFYNSNVSCFWPNQYKNLANALHQIVNSFVNSGGKSSTTSYECFAQIVATFNQYLIDNQPEEAFQYLAQSFVNLILNPMDDVTLKHPRQQALILTIIMSLMAMYYTLETQGITPEFATYNSIIATLSAELLSLIGDDKSENSDNFFEFKPFGQFMKFFGFKPFGQFKKFFGDNNFDNYKKFVEVQVAIFDDAYKYNYQQINVHDLARYDHEFQSQIIAIAMSFPNTVAPTYITNFTTFAQTNMYPNVTTIGITGIGYSLQLAVYLYALYNLLTPKISEAVLHKGQQMKLLGMILGIVSGIIDNSMNALTDMLSNISSLIGNFL